MHDTELHREQAALDIRRHRQRTLDALDDAGRIVDGYRQAVLDGARGALVDDWRAELAGAVNKVNGPGRSLARAVNAQGAAGYDPA